MAHNIQLADRVRKALSGAGKVEEKRMFGVLCFMVNGKMCVCVGEDELMCRIDPAKSEKALQKPQTRLMVQRGRIVRNCIFVKDKATEGSKEFDYWMNLSLDFNRMTQDGKAVDKRSGKKER